MFQLFPADVESPLFQVPAAGVMVPLTDSMARKHLKQVSLALSLCKPLTFYDFRGLGLPGPSSMECPYRPSRPRGHGLHNVSGDMCTSSHQGLLELLSPFVPT